MRHTHEISAHLRVSLVFCTVMFPCACAYTFSYTCVYACACACARADVCVFQTVVCVCICSLVYPARARARIRHVIYRASMEKLCRRSKTVWIWIKMKIAPCRPLSKRLAWQEWKYLSSFSIQALCLWSRIPSTAPYIHLASALYPLAVCLICFCPLSVLRIWE